MILGSADKALRVPFSIQPYNQGDTSTRLNLNLALPDANYEQYFFELDKHILNIVSNDYALFFGKDLSFEHVNMMYKPLLQQHEKYDSRIKQKSTLNIHPSSEHGIKKRFRWNFPQIGRTPVWLLLYL